MLFGMAAEIRSPLVAVPLALGGAALTLAYASDLGRRLSQDSGLQSALDRIWHDGDNKTFAANLPAVESSLGKESFALALNTVCAGGGYSSIGMLNKMLRPTAPELCPAGASTGAGTAGGINPEILAPAEAKPDTTLKMVWHRDRMGYEWDRLDPLMLEKEIQSTPLSKRLDKIEQLINEKQLYKAYDYAGANLKWHTEHSSKGDLPDQLCDNFWKIGMGIRNSWDEPNKDWLARSLAMIGETRTRFGDSQSWPFKIPPEQLMSADRLYDLPLKTRVQEIEKLVDSDMLKDAGRLSNWNYLLHRDPRNLFWNSKINGTANKLYDPAIADRFDDLHLHLMRLANPSSALKKLVPETSLQTIKAKLNTLKRS